MSIKNILILKLHVTANKRPFENEINLLRVEEENIRNKLKKTERSENLSDSDENDQSNNDMDTVELEAAASLSSLSQNDTSKSTTSIDEINNSSSTITVTSHLDWVVVDLKSVKKDQPIIKSSLKCITSYYV